jgi:hypothetical protein
MKARKDKLVLYEIQRLKQRLALPDNPVIPRSLRKQLRNSLKNYFESDFEHQRLTRMTISLRGKTDKYVFQMSHGSQQIKLYEPEKYKNHINTPLRIRTRMIMHLAHQTPGSGISERLRVLHSTYPYYLLKSQPVNLRLLNFRFERKVRGDDPLDIYETTVGNQPDPASDLLITTAVYCPKKSIKFEYEGKDEQCFYAVNTRNKELSNTLRFLWSDELQQLPG